MSVTIHISQLNALKSHDETLTGLTIFHSNTSEAYLSTNHHHIFILILITAFHTENMLEQRFLEVCSEYSS